jgi:hypothetical protein
VVGDVKAMLIVVLRDDGDCTPFLRGEEYCVYFRRRVFPRLWEDVYGMSTGIGSLNFIAMGAGFFLGTQITAPLNDMLYRRLKKGNNGVGKPEFRVPIMIPASLLVPIGLFMYGWSAQTAIHWIVPDM